MKAGQPSSMTPERASRLDAIGFQWNIRGTPTKPQGEEEKEMAAAAPNLLGAAAPSQATATVPNLLGAAAVLAQATAPNLNLLGGTVPSPAVLKEEQKEASV